MNSRELRLIRLTVNHDRAAMTELYDLYFPRLKRFLRGITHDSEAIEELVNDVMLTVWQQADRFRGDSTVSTWILGIAYRKGIDSIRKIKRYKNMITQLQEPQSLEPEINEITARHDLDILMRDLSAEQRAVAELSFDFGYSYPEIAKILDVPVNTVKTRMFYARKTMQGSLQCITRREA